MDLTDVVPGAVLPELVHLAAILSPAVGSAVVRIGRSGGHVRIHGKEVRKNGQSSLRFDRCLHGEHPQIVQHGKSADPHTQPTAVAALQQDILTAFASGTDAAGQRHRLFFLGKIIADRDLAAVAHYGQQRRITDTHPATGRGAFGNRCRYQNVCL